MEVHHHPDLHHRKKKMAGVFPRILNDFFGGDSWLFAESIREKISENHREKDYIHDFNLQLTVVGRSKMIAVLKRSMP